MLTVVTWKWLPLVPSYRSKFAPDTVRVLRDMVKRHYQKPHRFLCVTDTPNVIAKDIDTVPDWGDFKGMSAPTGMQNPSCYRRLRAFAPDIAKTFGERFVMLDLDTVITGDLAPLWDRPEDFIICGDTNPKTFYNGSMMLMTAGARSKVWTDFDPMKSPKLAFRAGHHGSDQAWISYCLGPHEKKFTRADGVYSFRNELKLTRQLPKDARMVIFHGRVDPWTADPKLYPWVREYWH